MLICKTLLPCLSSPLSSSLLDIKSNIKFNNKHFLHFIHSFAIIVHSFLFTHLFTIYARYSFFCCGVCLFFIFLVRLAHICKVLYLTMEHRKYYNNTLHKTNTHTHIYIYTLTGIFATISE